MEDTDEKAKVKLTAERTNLRRLLTKACKECETAASTYNTGKDIDVLFNKVADKAERLFKIDYELSLITEYSETEYDIIESYREKFIEIQTDYKKCSEVEIKELKNISTTNIDNLTLPKLDLKVYELTPRNWVAFWGQFSLIHEDTRIREEDKFQYLLSSLKLKSKARDIIESYPPSKINYAKAIEHLKSRFGRDDLLIEVYIRDLLTLVNNRSNTKLASLYDQLGTYLRALETLGVTKENYAAMLFPVVESCLPNEILKAWDRYRLNRSTETDNIKYPSKEKLLEELMNFLGNEVEGEEHRALAEGGFGSQAKIKSKLYQPNDIQNPSASVLTASVEKFTEKIKCLFCELNHNSQDCRKAGAMTQEERKAAVIRKRCCLVCLKPRHVAKNCRSSVRCLICGKRHFVILCPEIPLKKEDTSFKESSNKEDSAALFTQQFPSGIIYLKTLMVHIRNKGKTRSVRALLDDGSHRSYIEKNLVTELNIQASGKEILSQGLFGGRQTPEEEHGRYKFTLESSNRSYSCQISALDQDKICTTLPRVRDQNLIDELKLRGIDLTDIGKENPPIRLLIGADVLGKILTGRIEVLKSGISAIETKLGWCVLGSQNKTTSINMVSLSLQNCTVPDMWELDSLGISDPIERKSTKLLEEETLTQFRESIKVNKDQRYEVALPWLAGHPPLYDNYDKAELRLRTITKRLKKENLFDSYNAVFHQWQEESIIETVPENEFFDLSHYLPHHPVIKLSSATTKIRPVFNASFKQPGYASLNECLSVGPSLIQQIPPLLNRFRFGSIGVTADIKQAFLQLSVTPEDRNVLRFLWWENRECTKLKFYRHRRVVFGVSSSPFLLNATIIHHLNLEKFHNENLQSTVQKLKEGFYVDNLVTSVEDESQLTELRTQAQHIMKEGCFELRCWAFSGNQNVDDQMVLGLKWNVHTDELYCVQPACLKNEIGLLTKRKLLSIINSVYDPIGFTSPAMLLPKLILQEAWSYKISWDEELTLEQQQLYKKWAKNVDLIEKCTIPRRMFKGNPENASLHIFTDASSYAYACCVYVRCEDETGVSLQLVTAKARLAPIQRPTIPRLELLGAVIGARLGASVLEALKLQLKTYYWTDSMTVLNWIMNNEPWNTFIGNRVKEVRTLTDVQNWRHVPGEMNPADLPSRACNWSQLLQSRWSEGPKWLLEDKEFWPFNKITPSDEALLERRKTVVASTNLRLPHEKIGERFLYFSKYSKIIRMTAWILRFCNNSRKGCLRITGVLTSDELEKAERVLFRLIQSEWPTEIRDKYSQTIQFFEEDGILRIKTRLVLGDDADEFQRPVVLPDHPIVRRMIEQFHKTMKHSGVQVTLTQLRERYWIPRGRRIVKEVIHKCTPCNRQSVKPVTHEIAPLPSDRIKRVAAFQVTGIDLAGPVYLRNKVKAWIVLFTCAVYRAIHLELVTSLSTEAFMQAMRRFFARRGRCSVIYSDNGTNFVGTSRALRALDWESIISECALQNIKWKFNPPTAPWYGGWWERMVRSVKELLRKCLGKSLVTYEEMITLLCECESAVNGRPLTYLSEDPNELKPVTPAHFIQDIKGNDTLDLDIVDSNHLLKRIRYIQSLRDNIRQRFQREYLSELIRTSKVGSKRKSVNVGDVVIVGSDNLKRINWPLGRVIELFPGKDGIERVAKLRVANGQIIRPIQRIYPLELSSTDASNMVKTHRISENVNDVAESQTSDNTAKFSLENNVQRTRVGRLVVPPKRLDL